MARRVGGDVHSYSASEAITAGFSVRVVGGLPCPVGTGRRGGSALFPGGGSRAAGEGGLGRRGGPRRDTLGAGAAPVPPWRRGRAGLGSPGRRGGGGAADPGPAPPGGARGPLRSAPS